MKKGRYYGFLAALLLLSSSIAFVFQTSDNTQAIRPDSFDTQQITWRWLEFDKSTNYIWLDFNYIPERGEEDYTTIVPIVVYDAGSQNELTISRFDLSGENSRVRFMVNDPSDMDGHIKRIDIFAENVIGDRILVHTMDDVLLSHASDEFNGGRQ